jgi:hypothetical protein
MQAYPKKGRSTLKRDKNPNVSTANTKNPSQSETPQFSGTAQGLVDGQGAEVTSGADS